MIIYTLVLGELQTNCYLWADESTGNTIVVDAPDCANKIIEFAEDKGLRITDIILTHGHFDHMLAAAELKEKTGAKLSVFEKTVPFLGDSNLNVCHLLGAECKEVTPDKTLKDGDIIDFCGNIIKVLNTPGHTIDSICLYLDDTLFSGDTLFKGSIGISDFPTGNLQQEIRSIKEILLLLPDDTRVFPGHGPSTTIGEERRGNPYLI